MKSLRFCMVTTFYPPWGFGGDGIAVQNLSRALVADGHSVTVLHNVDAFRTVARDADASALPRLEKAYDDGVEVIPISTASPLASSLLAHQTGRPAVYSNAIRRVLDRGFDVIHFHNVSLMGGPGILRFGEGVKIYSAHEHWLVCGMHVLWKNGREPCAKRECIRCTLRAHRPPQLWRYTGALRRAGAHIDAFLAMSEFSRAKHREFGHPYEMLVLPTLVPDVPVLASASPHHRSYFLFSGRLEPIKGLADVIPIFMEPDTAGGADLLVAGTGTQRSELERLANGNPRSRFLGRVEPADLSPYYQQAIATIVPSVGFETLGLSTVESFRASTPVIARRIGPFPDLLDGGAGGLLFSDAAELRLALAQLARDPERGRQLATHSRQKFLEHWETAAALPRYLALVERLVQMKHAAAPSRYPASPDRAAARVGLA